MDVGKGSRRQIFHGPQGVFVLWAKFILPKFEGIFLKFIRFLIEAETEVSCRNRFPEPGLQLWSSGKIPVNSGGGFAQCFSDCDGSALFSRIRALEYFDEKFRNFRGFSPGLFRFRKMAGGLFFRVAGANCQPNADRGRNDEGGGDRHGGHEGEFVASGKFANFVNRTRRRCSKALGRDE